MDDLLARAQAQLVVCGICDYGVLGPCTCPKGDPRSVLQDLVDEVLRLRAELDNVKQGWAAERAAVREELSALRQGGAR